MTAMPEELNRGYSNSFLDMLKTVPPCKTLTQAELAAMDAKDNAHGIH